MHTPVTTLTAALATRLVTALAGLMLLVGVALAGPVNKNGSGLAIEGHDPVAYFTLGKAVAGSGEFTASHDGATYRFVSAAHRDQFNADPARYLPQYGGFCAYGMAQGYQASVQPDKFTIVDGKLYLNYNGSVQSRWRKDTGGYISAANANWLKQ